MDRSGKTQLCQPRVQAGALHLTQKVDYALFFLSSLGKQEGTVSIRSLSDEAGVSFSFLQKVAHLLQQAGFIRATRGKNGGYALARPANKISLGEIIECLDGPIAIVDCAHGTGHCARESFCQIKHGLQRMNTEIKEYYRKKTVSDFLT